MKRMEFVIFAAAALWGQEFEAASVKLHTAASASTGRSGIEETPGLIRIENLSLKVIIEAAYGVKDYQFAGPGWLDTVSFDITAKPPAGYKHEQLQPLLQQLLADRFKLAVHREAKQTAGFALVVGNRSKLTEATQPKDYFTVRPGLIQCKRVSMVQLANALSRIVGRPVVNDTGLTGDYEVKLEWTPEQSALPSLGEASEPALSLFTALQAQLGLRLQAQKEPIDTVMVDHVERTPTDN
jgi:uncharacterized protein (TIGR03435 family)